MRRCRKLTALILSAMMCVQMLPSSVAFASDLDDGSVVIQDETVVEGEEEISEGTEIEDGESETGEVDSEEITEEEDLAPETEEEDLSAEDAVEITALDKEYEVKLDEDTVTEKWFKFVPKEAGAYIFYSQNTDEYYCDTQGVLYDENITELSSDDDSRNGLDFQIIYNLEGGKTYYLKSCSDYCEGPFYVGVSKNTDLRVFASGTQDTYKNVYVKPHEKVTLSVDVYEDTNSKSSIRWYIVDNEGNQKIINGANGKSYLIEEVTNKSYFQCYVEDDNGNYDYVDFYVEVDNELKAYAEGTEDSYENRYVKQNEDVSLSVDVSAYDTDGITYKWGLYDDGIGRFSSIIENAIDSSCIIKNVTTPGYYCCEVEDKYGNCEDVFFNILIDNNLKAYASGTENTWADYSVKYKDKIILSVDVSAYNKEKLSYTWRFYDEEGYFQSVEGNSSYTIDCVTRRDEYECIVSDGIGNSCSVEFCIEVDNGLKAYVSGTKNTEENILATINTKQTLSIDVIADDMEGIEYQWINSNGYNISGANGQSYIINNVTKTDKYSCRVTDKYGNIRTVYFYINVDNGFKVYPLGEDNESNSKSYYVKPNSTQVLSVGVEAKDKEEITYAWQRTDENGYWYQIEGETGDSLTTEAIKYQTEYECVAMDKFGNYSTAYFYIYVDNGLKAYPMESNDEDDESISYTVKPGDTQELGVNVIAEDKNGISFVWYDDDRNEIEGADKDKYTINNATKAETYYCTVTDKYGNSVDVCFYISLDNGLKAYASGTQSSIYTFIVSPGTIPVLSVDAFAEDMEGITYQWYDHYWDEIEGETKCSYTYRDFEAEDRCYCTVYDRYGNTASVEFYIDIDNDFSAFISGTDCSDVNYTVNPNERKTLSVEAKANDISMITYQWYESTDNESWIEIEGANKSSLDTGEIKKSCIYQCEVSDGYGTSSYLYFYINLDNGFSAYVSGTTSTTEYYYVEPKESKTLSVTALANDMTGITYQWYIGNGESNKEKIKGADADSYKLINIINSGDYICVVEDRYGNTESICFKVRLQNNLNAFVSGTQNSRITYCVKPNEKKMLEVDVEANDLEGIKYEWYVENADNKNDYTKIESAKQNIYTTNAISEYSRYYCEVTDKYGNTVIVYFIIEVENRFNLFIANTREKSAQYKIRKGEKRTFCVDTEADDPKGITYQWSVDGFKVEGETGTSFITDKIEDHTYFSCIAKDKYGNERTVYFYINAFTDGEFHVYASGTKMVDQVYYVKPNEKKNLAVDVIPSDETDLTYKWFKYDDKACDYVILKDKTLSSLQLDAIKQSAEYMCTVTRSNGDSRSAFFNIVVNNNFKAYVSGTTSSSTTYNVKPKGSQKLSVTVTADDTKDMTYTWYKKDTNGDWDLINEATKITYDVGNITTPQSYQCIVRDRYGNTRYIYFYIEVNNLSAYVSGTSKASVRYLVGTNESKTLSVDAKANDKDSITYTWYGSDGKVIKVATGNSYKVDKLSSNASYHCVVKDGYGNRGTVYFDISIDNELKAFVKGTTYKEETYYVKKNAIQTLAVDVKAKDTSEITYRWYRQGYGDLEGATGSSITTDKITQGETYFCVVKDKYGNSASVYFYLEVNNLRAYVAGTKDYRKEFYVPYNKTQNLSVDVFADDKDKLTYVWYVDGYVIERGLGKTSITTDAILTRKTYTCKVTDKYGNSCWVYFVMCVDNGFSAYVSGTKATQKAFYITKDQIINLSADVNAKDKDELIIEWYGEGVDLLNNKTTSIKTDKISQNTIIRCYVSDKYGNNTTLEYNVYLKQFSDVNDTSYYTEPVYWALSKGITTGTTATTFSPLNNCKREEFVTFLWRYYGSPEPRKTTYFSDVNSSKFYYKAVMWAAEQGITTGYKGTTKFGVGDECTREQCVTFIFRAAGEPRMTADDYSTYNKFNDVKSKDYYYNAVTWAAKNGITTGVNSTQFGSGMKCTRGMLVTFLSRYNKNN